MFDHVTIRTADRGATERFYEVVLGSIGIEATHADDELLAWDDFWVVSADSERDPTRHLHIAFVAPTPEHVNRFWRAGVEAGYQDDGPPGLRPEYRPDYYGAFLLDPDGNSAEAVHYGGRVPGRGIDHLWIGVSHLAAGEAFYDAIAPAAGLRQGRRWEHGVQFRGAGATFSLVSDGRPATEGLTMAFPAAARDTVDAFHRAAVEPGYASTEEPAERGPDSAYSAAVLDPDGTIVESVCRERL